MEHRIDAEDRILITVTADEVLTFRHGIIEALGALSDSSFRIRTGGEPSEARDTLSALMEISREHYRRFGH